MAQSSKCLLFFLALTAQITCIAQFPENFTPINVEVLGNVADGYIFMTPFPINGTVPYQNNMLIMDKSGKQVLIVPIGGVTGTLAGNFVLHKNGMMSYTGNTPSKETQIYLLDSTFNLVDTVVCGKNRVTGYHEMLIKPNGNYLLKCEFDSTMDLSSLVTDNGVPGDPAGTVAEDIIQELDPNKNVIWEWRALDYFNITDSYKNYFRTANFLDLSHCNSIDIDTDGNYVVSFRNTNEITKIDASGGNIIWRLGGKNNQFTILGDTGLFSGQHDARMHPGNVISLFDNSVASPFLARALEYRLDIAAKTATVHWQHANSANLSSQFVGNVQRLPNGNKMINWGAALPTNQITSIIEIDPTGQEVLKIDLPDNMTTYRARKYELPFTIHRPAIQCEDFTLTADSGYTTYYWNTGDTTQSITITDTGRYQVWCNYGIGYVSSEEFYVSDMNNICGYNGAGVLSSAPAFSVYPNPAVNELNIRLRPQNEKRSAHITDIRGKFMKTVPLIGNESAVRIDISPFPAGIYFIGIGNVRTKFIVIR